MSFPVSPPAPQPEKSKAGRGKRGCLITGIILALLIPGFYLLENCTGRRALRNVVAEYADAGFTLEPAAFLTAAAPAEENFGATPLLDGIMHPDDGSPAGKAAKEKRKILGDLLPDIGLSQRTRSPPRK